mgnify:CR=1 FL=1
MRRVLRWGVPITGALVLVGIVIRAFDDAPDGWWVAVLSGLVVLAVGAVVVAAVIPTPEQPMKRVRRLGLAWLALTIVSAPFAYGAPLLLTGPGLAAITARLYVGTSSVPGRTSACVLFGPAILLGGVWFASRVDEVPWEAIPSLAIITIGLGGLLLLRRQSSTPG